MVEKFLVQKFVSQEMMEARTIEIENQWWTTRLHIELGD